MSILPLPLTVARDLAPVVRDEERLDELGKTAMLASVIYLEAGQPSGPFVVPTKGTDDAATRRQLEQCGAWAAACGVLAEVRASQPAPRRAVRVAFAAMETGLDRAEVVQWADGPVLLVPRLSSGPTARSCSCRKGRAS